MRCQRAGSYQVFGTSFAVRETRMPSLCMRTEASSASCRPALPPPWVPQQPNWLAPGPQQSVSAPCLRAIRAYPCFPRWAFRQFNVDEIAARRIQKKRPLFGASQIRFRATNAIASSRSNTKTNEDGSGTAVIAWSSEAKMPADWEVTLPSI